MAGVRDFFEVRKYGKEDGEFTNEDTPIY